MSPVSNIQSIKTVLHENKSTFLWVEASNYCQIIASERQKADCFWLELEISASASTCQSRRGCFLLSLSFFFKHTHTPYLLASSSRFFIVAVKWPVEELHFFWHPEVRLSFGCAKGNYVVRDVWFVEILHTLNM